MNMVTVYPTDLQVELNNTSCLNNAEQMGEGWSDYVGLMLTMEPGDQGSDIRGIGTYATGSAN